MRRIGCVAAVLVVLGPAAATALARDYAGFARNVVPSGQYGAVPPPAGADRQARMYDGLTPLFDRVTAPDLMRYFKSAALGVGGPPPRRVEPTPRKGLRIVRDAFNVPHITGKTRDDATWGAGWVMAEDRALVLAVARGDSYLAAVDPPNLNAFDQVRAVRTFEPSARTRAFVARQTQVLKRAGPKGAQLLHDIDVYIQGLNARLEFDGGAQKPFARPDIYASNALLAQFLGQGGGDEARRSQFLDGLRKRFGPTGGLAVFNDLRERNDPETTVTVDGRFPYGRVPRHATGNVVLDNGSLELTGVPPARASAEQHASNVLMVSARRSKTGHPLFIGGPQIGYFYPGLTYEMDFNAPGEHWRGATAPPFPGYMLIGRGEDFASSLTSAGSDIIDHFAETLCGDDLHYRYRGRCRKMGTFDAGRLSAGNGEPAREVVFRTTVHGPVIAYARSEGRRVAISSKRSSRGREALFQLAFQDMSVGRVRDPQSFFRAFGRVPLTFNALYADSTHVAEYTAGRLPLRARDVDPGLPTNGDGDHEWRGFLPADAHPHGTDPHDGIMTNWNNVAAHGFQASDKQWSYQSIQRNELLRRGLQKRRMHDLASLTSAMNAAATQDVRAVMFLPTLAAVLSKGAPNARDAEMLRILRRWRKAGGSRLDRDLDGLIDHPGAAIMDEAWFGLAHAAMDETLGRKLADQLATFQKIYDDPVDQQSESWMGYLDKDLRTMLGRPVRGRYSRRYCGKGDLTRCRRLLWEALDRAGNRLARKQGPNPRGWRADATAERKRFQPINMAEIRYANRPTGIQTVATFVGHR
ncbi:MAG TPA: penicillin acylase family protein [Thermoleophilaceae bacterium]|nr:penicillin acylase family protein [Thermoleophilaceae bacterium]